jgi:hypothetical protein
MTAATIVQRRNLRSALRVEIHNTPVADGTAAQVLLAGDILNKTEQFASLRNITGCHFDDLAFHLREARGIECGKLVLELADGFLHPEHGWPASDK